VTLRDVQAGRGFNNAAINPPTKTILQDTLENWRRTIEINLEAVYA
jgi:NAD(P)-dependent dehydrogenase (short-subunit alcohol dehydrogenase family)